MSFITKTLINIIKTRNYSGKIVEVAYASRRNYCQRQQKPDNPVNDYTLRSHTCGELTADDIGKEVTICGWLQYQRLDRFAILRDAYGLTQIVINRDDLMEVLQETPLESVISVRGIVKNRPKGQANQKMSTGDIEIDAQELYVLGKVEKQLPFTIRDYSKANETNRMKYRYLDLRFPEMQRNLRLRSEILMKMREFLIKKKGFVEVETPTLFKKTPGGAQEFIVPTQTPGNFYSLVQSPQQLKQLLMVGGVDRYFQVARCYRDETSRPDRQPEFTQLDIELSFTDAEGVISLVEDLLVASLPEELGITKPFNRMSFQEAMESYGTDQPDLSISCKIKTLEHESLGVKMRYLIIPGAGMHLNNTMKGEYLKLATQLTPGASLTILKNPGSDWDKYAKKLKGWATNGHALKETLGVQENDVVFISSGPDKQVFKLLGKLRTLLVNTLRNSGLSGAWDSKSVSKNNLLWIVDFPLFEQDGNQIKSTHHPFTCPMIDDIDKLDTNPLEVKGLHYDLVMNGWEIGGGSVRIHNAQLQNFILNDILKIRTEDLAHLLDGLQSGAPPHAGIALGIDRLISILVGAKSIRDVIAFPKSSDARDLMTGAPSRVNKDDLKLYNVEVIEEQKQENQIF